MLVASTFIAATGAAASQGKPKFALSYDARASCGCPSADQLRAGVAAELGYTPFSDDATTMLSITIRPTRAGVRGRVEMRLADGRRVGERDLTAASCDELTAALVLTVVMAIDPMHSVTTPKPRVATSQQRPPPPPPPPKPQPPRQPTSNTAAAVASIARHGRFDLERPHLFVAADAHVAIQEAPTPAFGLSADIGAAASHWSAAIELRGDVPSSADVLGSRVTASLLLAAFVPCGRYGFAAVCAVVGGGGQSVNSGGLSYWVGYGVAGGRLEVAVPVSRRWALVTRIDGIAVLVGKEDPRPSWRSPIAVLVGVGVAARVFRTARR